MILAMAQLARPNAPYQLVCAGKLQPVWRWISHLWRTSLSPTRL